MMIGHQKQWNFLKKSAELDRISHAYLFQGQAHLGKKVVAKEFIKLINCQSKTKSLCQTCWSCQSFQREIHPDLIFIKPDGKEIKISQIRYLQRFLSFKPHSSLFKAIILEEGEKMNLEAQGCLLKTLEEPSDNSLLLLLTKHPGMLLPTVLSRVQTIKFFPVPDSEIKDYLKKQKLLLPMIESISSLSFGRPGLALEFLKDPNKLEKARQKIEEIAKISQQDLALRFKYAKDSIAKEQDLKEVLESWLRYFRDILRQKIGLATELKILPSAANFSVTEIKGIVNRIEEINFLISSTNVNQRLALEQIMIEL